MNKTGRKFVDLTKFIPGFYWREENNQVYSWIILEGRKQPSLFLDSTGGKKTRCTVQPHTINSKGF
jgi:hypothetical protein